MNVNAPSRDQSDNARYRVREYDTNRDPRGPLSATAEVLYGMITDLIIGATRLPGQVVSILPGISSDPGPKDYKGREWAMSHFAECLTNQEHRAVTQTTTANGHPSGNEGQSDGRARGHTGIDHSSNLVAHESAVGVNESQHSKATMEEGETKTYHTRYGHAKHALFETRYHAVKSAYYALNFALILPTDFTLSLSKGFHNAPKLYHDETVKPIPKVVGIKTGFRAAGKVSKHM